MLVSLMTVDGVQYPLVMEPLISSPYHLMEVREREGERERGGGKERGRERERERESFTYMFIHSLYTF